MRAENFPFRISASITKAVMVEANSHEETLEYAKEVLQKVRENKNHRLLYRYLQETAAQQGEYWYSYGIASALSYDLVTRRLEEVGIEVEFSEDEITQHKAIADSAFGDPRWNDERWVLERTARRKGAEADSDLGLFLTIVDATAPEFGEEITDFTHQIEIPVNRKHVLRGFFDGFMPFYVKMLRLGEME